MKKVVSVILILALCLSLSSCNIDFGFGDYDYEKHNIALGDEKINVGNNDYKQDGYAGFIDKLSLFAAKLSHEIYLSGDLDKNIAISPISVYMALALATECANGETRDEILRAVGVSYEEVKNFTKTLYAYTNRTFYSNGENKDVSAFEELANSIWADNDVELKENGVSVLAKDFNCDLFSVDYATDEANDAINAYIKDKTHGLIDGGVDLSPETLITLINTFYLKEIWNNYGEELTFTDIAYAFVNADGSQTNTKLLKGYYSDGKVYEGEGYSSFFTKTNHNFNIKFILPNDGHSIDEVFTAENIYHINSIKDYGTLDNENMLRHHTRVFFPEYEASYDGNIGDVLKNSFNIEKMFSPEECDFSNITDETVACDGVVHKCELKVNRKGIEGAAVTYIPLCGAVGPGQYKDVYHDFIVDRAFGFIITDNYGVVLFCGVVNNV